MQTTTSNMANFKLLAEMMRKYPGDAGLRSADMHGHLFETKTVSPSSFILTALDAIILQRTDAKTIQYAREVIPQHHQTEFPL